MMSKKVLLFLMCCAIFTASCSEKKKELTPGERMEAEYKYDKLPDSKKSKIKFLKYEHDFGKVGSKKLQKVRFDFQNIGKSPLILHDVHGYCGCIEASFSKTPIMPGKKGSIIITYDGKGSVIGSFNKEIVVNSNASNKYISLFVKGVNQ